MRAAPDAARTRAVPAKLGDGGDGRDACADLYRDLYDRLAGADRMREDGWE